MTDRNYRIELNIDDGYGSRTMTYDTKDHKIYVDGGFYPWDLELIGALTRILRPDQQHGAKVKREDEDNPRRGPFEKL
jgi:hypothetical protein